MDIGGLIFVGILVFIVIYDIFDKQDANLIAGLLVLSLVLTYWLSIDFKCWVNQEMRNTDSYAEWHFEQTYDAVKDDDLDEVKLLTHNLGEWLEVLNEDEMKIYDQTVNKWEEEHPYKFETITVFYQDHHDVLYK